MKTNWKDFVKIAERGVNQPGSWAMGPIHSPYPFRSERPIVKTPYHQNNRGYDFGNPYLDRIYTDQIAFVDYRKGSPTAYDKYGRLLGPFNEWQRRDGIIYIGPGGVMRDNRQNIVKGRLRDYIKKTPSSNGGYRRNVPEMRAATPQQVRRQEEEEHGTVRAKEEGRIPGAPDPRDSATIYGALGNSELSRTIRLAKEQAERSGNKFDKSVSALASAPDDLVKATGGAAILGAGAQAFPAVVKAAPSVAKAAIRNVAKHPVGALIAGTSGTAAGTFEGLRTHDWSKGLKNGVRTAALTYLPYGNPLFLSSVVGGIDASDKGLGTGLRNAAATYLGGAAASKILDPIHAWKPWIANTMVGTSVGVPAAYEVYQGENEANEIKKAKEESPYMVAIRNATENAIRNPSSLKPRDWTQLIAQRRFIPQEMLSGFDKAYNTWNGGVLSDIQRMSSMTNNWEKMPYNDQLSIARDARDQYRSGKFDAHMDKFGPFMDGLRKLKFNK